MTPSQASGQQCRACSNINDATARFCSSCGERLVESDQQENDGERRHLTVLFADIVGSTERAAALEEALKLVPDSTLGTIYKEEFETLAALAPESELVATIKKAEKTQRQREEFRRFFVEKDFEGALGHADAILDGAVIIRVSLDADLLGGLEHGVIDWPALAGVGDLQRSIAASELIIAGFVTFHLLEKR